MRTRRSGEDALRGDRERLGKSGGGTLTTREPRGTDRTRGHPYAGPREQPAPAFIGRGGGSPPFGPVLRNGLDETLDQHLEDAALLAREPVEREAGLGDAALVAADPDEAPAHVEAFAEL